MSARRRLAAALLLGAGLLMLPARGAPPDERPLLVAGGRLLEHPPGTAVLLVGERIAAVGPEPALRAEAGPRVAVLDARGGLVLPGFHDGHIHLLAGGLAARGVDLDGLASLDAVQAALAAHAAAHPGQGWVRGRGWSYDLVPAGSFPSRQALDAAVPDRPVALDSYDGHALWVSSRALELAGVGPDTPDPPDGRIVREPDGRTPAGVLLEGAQGLVERAIPAIGRAERLEALRAALADCLRQGITSIETIASDPDEVELWEELLERGELRCRVSLCLPLGGDLDRYERLRRRLRSPWLRLGYLKEFVDGVIESRTAYMVDPYVGSDERGRPLLAPDELKELVRAAHARGFPVGLHAIGDAAVRLALDAYEEARRRHPGVRITHRIEHLEVVHPDDLPRLARLGVVASMQPYHAVPADDSDRLDEGDVWSWNLGPERLRRSFPWRDLLDHGAALSFGSDWPVMTADPLRGLAVATTRRNERGLPAAGWNAHQAISFPEAVRAYTEGPAAAIGRGRELGRIAPGYLADLVVLSPAIDPARPATLWTGEVEHVIVAGRLARTLR